MSHADAGRMIERLLVSSPYRITPAARSGTIRYEVGFEDGRSWNWPETGEQRIAEEGTRWLLTVCRECGREGPPNAADLELYRAANDVVDSDHPAVQRFARKHAGGGSVDRRMRRLVEAVRTHMDGPIDFSRYYSASQALRSRSGDCTESAVLLAATARAVGLPARLAFGVAYSSRFTGHAHVFSPHAWVQVWDGARWRSYDAGLGKFDAGMLALHVGDGSTADLPEVTRSIEQLRIDSATELRRRPRDRSSTGVVTADETRTSPRN